jgi:hypothetical protein
MPLWINGIQIDDDDGGGSSLLVGGGDKLIYSTTSIPAGDTFTSGTGGTKVFASTYTIPANSLLVGDVIRLKARGVFTIGSSGVAWDMAIKFGATTMIDTGTFTLPINQTNRGWEFEADFIVQTPGSGGLGSIEAQGKATFVTVGGGTFSVDPNPANVAPIAIDLTIAQAITLTWLGNVTAGNSITLRELVIEHLAVS